MLPNITKSVVRMAVMLAAAIGLHGCQDDDAVANGKKFDGAMVMALSWQPAFCEGARRRPECRSQKVGRYDVTHFSIHGLWPQPGSNVYCGVDDAVVETDKARRWRDLEGLGLSDAVKQALWKAMPGSQSFLHRHEWIKHGTCYSEKPETYYRDTLWITDAINRSPVQSLFERSIGKPLNNRTIRKAFDQAFSDGAGERVRVACRRDGDRQIITEITIGLKGEIGEQADLASLIAAAPKTEPGCPRGIVDPVGFQ